MRVQLPDGIAIDIDQVVSWQDGTSAGVPILTFALVGGGTHQFDCVDNVELAILLETVRRSLKEKGEYIEFPSRATLAITSLEPNNGVNDEPHDIVVTGAGFGGNGQVTINGELVVTRYINNTKLVLSLLARPGVSGAVDVVYTDSRGSVTKSNGWTFNAP